MTLGESGGDKKSFNGTRRANKKNKKPQRGMSVEQLERLRIQAVRSVNVSFPPVHVYTPTPTPSPTPTPALLYQGLMGPYVFGSSNVKSRFENPKVLPSVPVLVKCDSNGCSHKINGGRYICTNNTFAEIMDSSKSCRCHQPQASDIMSVHMNRGSPLMEFEFFPEKGSGSAVGEWSSEAAISGNKEGNRCSLDLSLKLSY